MQLQNHIYLYNTNFMINALSAHAQFSTNYERDSSFGSETGAPLHISSDHHHDPRTFRVGSWWPQFSLAKLANITPISRVD